jgi:hypothetical protein
MRRKDHRGAKAIPSGDMAMTCPKCGTGNDENAKVCQACGWALEPAHAQRPAQVLTDNAIQARALVLVIVVILVVAGVGAPYLMPLSKIKLIVTHNEYSSIGVRVYIDGISKGLIGVSAGTSIVGVWSVVAGTHTVALDRGHWDVLLITQWPDPDEYVNNYDGPDGTVDFTYAYDVGPLYTKNVFIDLS